MQSRRAAAGEALHEGLDFMILAFPRSGSSALRHRLNSFREIDIPPECAFATWVANHLRDDSEDLPERFIREVRMARKFEHWRLTDSDVASCSPRHIDEVLMGLRSLYARHRDRHRPSARLVGDKNNSYVFNARRALEVLAPEAVLLIWRDPAEVWSSVERLRRVESELGPERTPYFPVLWASREELVAAWIEVHGTLLDEVFSANGPRRRLAISHDDFVSNHSAVIERVLRFLAFGPATPEPPPAALLEPKEFAPWKHGAEDPSFRPHRLLVDPLTVAERVAVDAVVARLRAVTS